MAAACIPGEVDAAQWTRANHAVREWFAVHVWPGRERLCARHLRARGYDVFLPHYNDRRLSADACTRIERALFAGYVFCLIDAEVLPKLAATRGVIRMAGHERPRPIVREQIDALRRVMDAGLNAEPCRSPTTGQWVRMATGPLHGVEGTLIAARDGHRLVLSVSMLEHSVSVEVEPAWIGMPADASVVSSYGAS